MASNKMSNKTRRKLTGKAYELESRKANGKAKRKDGK